MNLLPKFSIRQLFFMLAVASMVLLFASDAYQGGAIGTAMTASVLLLIPCLLVMGIVYWVGWAVSKLEQRLWLRRFRCPPYQEPSNQSNSSTNKPANLLLIGLALTGLMLASSEKTAIAFLPVQYSSQGPVTVNRPLSGDALSIVVDDQFPHGGQGMRFIRVTISTHSQLPVKRDQDFTICFDPSHRYRYYHETGVSYFKHATIPAGSSSISTEMYISPNISHYSERMSIGRGRWNGISNNRQRVFTLFRNTSRNSPDSVPTLLISSAIDATLGVRKFIADQGENQGESIFSTTVKRELLPDLNGLMQLEVDDQTNYRLPDLNVAPFHACHPDDLPSSWIGLSSIERIFITASELENLIENAPFHRLTVSSWLAAGGALVVLDAGDSVSKYDDLIARLTIPMDRFNTSELTPAAQRKWIYPSQNQAQFLWKRRLSGIEIKKGGQNYSSISNNPNEVPGTVVSNFLAEEKLDSSLLWSIFDQDSASDSFPAYMLTDHNRGQVVMVSVATDSWDLNQWGQLTNSLQLQGIAIRGMLRSNQQTYARETFAIEGVGDPPLVLFQILMTLFVIVAGPMVFVLLKRSRNLQLMFLIVPAISLTACLGMVGNAVFLEGFGSKGRIDSVTWLDHRTDSAVSQVRACYYHGRSPGEYQFFQDTLPMDFQRTELTPSNTSFRVHLGTNATSISGGNFQSRMPHQVVSLRSYQWGQQLRWQFVDDHPAGVFENGLETELRLVVVKKDSGWVIAENLATGQAVAGTSISEELLNNKLVGLAKEMSPRYYQSAYSRGWYSSSSMSNMISTSVNFGGEFDVVSALQNRNGWQELVPENGYLAICDSLPYLDSQVVNSPSPQFLNQLHVVIGKW